jgi:uncharacterized membrane protein
VISVPWSRTPPSVFASSSTWPSGRSRRVFNDPTSAAECIQRIGQLLVAAGTRRQPESCVHDDDGSLRVLVPQRDFGELVELAFDQMRQYGHGNADVLVTMLETLYLAASALPSARRVPLQRQANLIGKGIDAIPIDADRERVVAAIEKMHAL